MAVLVPRTPQMTRSRVAARTSVDEATRVLTTTRPTSSTRTTTATVCNTTLRHHDLSAAGRETLAVLAGADGPPSPRVIADRPIVTAATITSVPDRLERHGLVERTMDQADRRRQPVSFTPAGRGAVDADLPKILTLPTRSCAAAPRTSAPRSRRASSASATP